MNVSDTKKLKNLLEMYLHKLNTDTLEYEEQMNLISFFVNDPSNFVDEKASSPIDFTETQIQQFTTLGWLISSFNL